MTVVVKGCVVNKVGFIIHVHVRYPPHPSSHVVVRIGPLRTYLVYAGLFQKTTC